MENQTEQKQKNNILPIALGAGLLLSLGFNAYQFVDNKNSFFLVDLMVQITSIFELHYLE